MLLQVLPLRRRLGLMGLPLGLPLGLAAGQREQQQAWALCSRQAQAHGLRKGVRNERRLCQAPNSQQLKLKLTQLP